MTHAEIFALDEWLTEYPDNKTYDEICDLIRDEDESVVPWIWFEHTPASSLIENIDNTRSHFEHTVNRMKTEGVLA